MEKAQDKPERWPDIVFTERFPKFYIDKLTDGTDQDKCRAAWQLYQASHGNNHNARQLKEYEGGLDALAKFYKDDTIEGKDIGGLMDMVGNLLHMMGHLDFKEGFMCKGSGINYFNTLPYTPPKVESAA